MATKQLTIALLFKAIDQLVGPARNILRSIEDIDRAAARAKGLRSMGDDLNRVGGNLQRVGAGIAAAGAGLAYVSGLSQGPGFAITAQHDLLAIGNTADLSAEQVEQARVALAGIARETNQYQADLLKGLGTLTAAGLDFATSVRSLPAIGRTATAETANVDDLANAAFSAISNLKVSVGDLATTLDMMAAAGHAGQFELRDMAQYFPGITASASLLGLRGTPAVLSLAASLQIARRGAGDASTAANNLKNFLDKIASPEVQRNFKAMGVSIEQEITGALARGEDPIMHMVQLIQRLTQGNPFQLGNLIGDIQAQAFLKPMLQNLQDFERIKRESAQGGIVDKDFARIMTSVAEQSRQFRINMMAIGARVFSPFMSMLQSFLALLNRHPWLQWLTAIAAITLTLGGITIAVFGTILVGAGAALTAVGNLTLGMAALRAGWIGATASLSGTAAGIAKFGSVLRLVTIGTWNFTAALLANPLTWIVLGIVAVIAAIVLLIKHWDSVVAALDRVWTWMKDAGSAMREAGANLVNQLWAGIQSLALKPIRAIRAIVQRIRNLLPFSPAKEGPLRDLHRVRIVETIAGTMQPAPMLRAMRTVALATATSGAALSAQLPARASGGQMITLNYSPQITIGAGAGADVRPMVESALAAERRRLEQMLTDIAHDQARVRFSS